MRRLALVIALAAACGTPPRPPHDVTTATKPQPTEPQPPKASAPTITASEATLFAQEWLTVAAPCHAVNLAPKIDHDGFLQRVRERTDPAGREMVDMLAGANIESVKICAWLDGADLQLLRVRDVAGEKRPLLRKMSWSVLAYFELALVRAADGTIRAVDMRSLNHGEWISDEIAATANISALVYDLGPAANVNRAREKQDAGLYVEALAALDDLPAVIRGSRPIQNWRVEVASNISVAAHLEAIDERRAAFPDIKATPFQAMSEAFARGDGAAALAAIDALDREVGGDPELERYRIGARLLAP